MKKTRLFSLALCLALCLALLPTAALADGGVKPFDVYQGDGFYITATPLIIKDARYTLLLDTQSIPGDRQFSEGLLMVQTDPENDDNYVNRQFVREVNFVDKNGNLLFPYGTLPYLKEIHKISDDTGLFHDGLCLYWDGKAVDARGRPMIGYIDKQGRVVVDCQFDGGTMNDWRPFSDGLAYVREAYQNKSQVGQEKYYIDTAGNRVAELDTMENKWMYADFHDGLARYYDDASRGHGGYYNKQGEQVIQLGEGLRLYYDFSEGYAIVQDLSAGELSYTYVIIDTTGREVGRFSDAEPLTSVHDGLIRVEFIDNRNQSDGRGYIDVTGKVVFRKGEEDPFGLCSYRHSFSCGLAVARDGLIDKAGNLVIPSEHFSFPTGIGKDNLYFNDNLAVAYSSNEPYVLEKHSGTYSGPGTIYNAAKGGAVTVPTQPETPPVQPSGDMPSSWAAEPVKAAVAAGIVPEALQSQYGQAITRAEFCALAVELYETVTGSEIADRLTFTDTTDPNVEKMAALKVVNGEGDGIFNPSGRLTRQQAAAMLSRLADALNKPLTKQDTTFADKSSFSAYAVEPIGQMQATGVMNGVGDNKFDPNGAYTREQSIVTMMRLFDIVK